MYLNFTKMHGLGNDFMVARMPPDAPDLSPERVRDLSDRRTGIGFDSLLLISDPHSEKAEAAYRVINADGGEVEQCGNGVRCIASFLGAQIGRELVLESAAGEIEVRVLADETVSVNLGEPHFEPADLPFDSPKRALRYSRLLNADEVEFGIASMGNPHAVIDVNSVDDAPVGILGAELATHRDFPRGVNVGFMQRVSDSRIRLRVYERGVGETRACGTGAAAAVAVGRIWGELGERVEVSLPGGTLIVQWEGPGTTLWQTGPSKKVYDGRIEL